MSDPLGRPVFDRRVRVMPVQLASDSWAVARLIRPSGQGLRKGEQIDVQIDGAWVACIVEGIVLSVLHVRRAHE